MRALNLPVAVPLAAALVLLTPEAARAAGVDALVVQASVASADVGEKDFGEVEGEDQPSVLEGQHVVAVGSGKMMGVGLRGVTQSREGYRFGLAAGFFATEGLGISDLEMPSGLRAEAASLWGGSFEVSLGKAFVGMPVQPYIDLRLVTNVVHVDIQFSSDEHGTLGMVGYDSPSVSVGPRLGLFIPIGDTLCIDLSGTYGLFGIERAGISVGLGVWDGILDDE